MAKLTVELIPEKAPGSDAEIGLNERKPSDVQYFLADRLLKIYLGPKRDLNKEKVLEKVSEANWKDISETEVELRTSELPTEIVEAAYEMMVLKSFIFDKYKTDPAARHVQIKKVGFKPKKPEGLELSIRDEIISAVKFCRDIVSTNADTITPEQMQKFSEELGRHKNINVRTIDVAAAQKLGMECLLAVGAESIKNSRKDHHPRLVVLEYTGENFKANSKSKNQEHIVLVGKGITFDSGGLCLKPNNAMLDMKSDMAGAAVVLSVFKAISNLSHMLSKNLKVTGIIALAENSFGSSSYKPGDILKAMNGKTVEVVDTDAEGRLVLVDALGYASKLDSPATKVIDIATLTGSIVSTLGEVAAGAMTNDKDFYIALQKAFREEGEKIWEMPLFDEYKKILDSDIADIKHCNTKPDALCAGIFLREFIPENSQWLHLDIAGVGFIEKDGLWAYKGATGFGVKGIIRYLLGLQK